MNGRRNFVIRPDKTFVSRDRIRKEINELKTGSEENSNFKLIFDKKTSKLVRFLWFLISSICTTICCYQTYERVQYYRSGPYQVDVEIRKIEELRLPPLMLSTLDTPSLAPYWNSLKDLNFHDEMAFCFSPVRNLIGEKVNTSDYHQLWLDSNFTQSIKSIRITKYGKELHETKLQNGQILHQRGIPITIKYIFTPFGLSFVLDTGLFFGGGLQLNLLYTQEGHCDTSVLYISTFNDIHPFQYTDGVVTSTEVDFTILVDKYKFLSKRKFPCEVDKNKYAEQYKDCRLKNSQYDCRLPFTPIKEETPDCNFEPNKTIVGQTYEKAFINEISVFDDQKCISIKLCEKISYSILKIQTELPTKDKAIINIFAKDEMYTLMSEKYIYDFIKLLIDFGGNIGFSLGLSLLSIVQYVHISLSRLWTRKQRRPNKKLIHLIKTQLEIQTKNSSSTKTLQQIVVITFVIMSLYLSILKVEFYQSEPTRFIVNLQENSTLYLPNIIFCSDTFELMKEKKRLADESGQEICAIHFLDLMDLKKEPPTLNTLWEYTNFGLNEMLMEMTLKTGKGLSQNFSLNHTNMHTGECLELQINRYRYTGRLSQLLIVLDDLDNTCNGGVYQAYIRRPGEEVQSILTTKRNLGEDTSVRLSLKLYKKVLLNLKSQPCIDTEKYKQCEKKCFETKFQRFIKCKLPFMKVYGKPVCETSSEAKVALNTFLKFSIKTNIEKECQCHPPCQDLTFQTVVTYTNGEFVRPVLLIDPVENVIREFRQITSYNIEALFCDVGNSFALTVGLSLIALPLILLDIKAQLHRIQWLRKG